MGQEKSIAVLRSRVSALVQEEAALLTQAFEISRNGGDRAGVDALFAQVQALQVERVSLKRELGGMLGTYRMHEASEVWRPGVYDYRREVGAPTVRVRVTTGPLGLQVTLPDRRDPVRIETLEGSFDGPLAGDDAQPAPVERAAARPRAPKKKAR